MGYILLLYINYAAACRLLIKGNLERNHSWESVGQDSN